MTPSGFDGALSVFTGSCSLPACLTLTPSGGGFNTPETVTFNVSKNATYYVELTAYQRAPDGGAFTLSLQ